MLIAIGIMILGWIVMLVITMVAMALSTGVALSTKDVNTAIGASVLSVIVVAAVAILFGLSHIVVRFIAHIDTTAAPERERARSLAVWGLWLYIGYLVLPVLYFLLMLVCGGMVMQSQSASTAGVSAILTLIVSILFYIAWLGITIVGGCFVWLFFLRACAKLVRAPGLAQSILYLILAVAILIAMGLAMGGLSLLGTGASIGAGLTPPPGPGFHPAPGPTAASGLAGVLGFVQLGCSCLTLFLVLATFVWTIVSMFLVRSAITRYIEGRA